MNKTIFLASVAAIFFSCTGGESKTEPETPVETTATPAEAENSTVTPPATYTAEDGDVMWKDGKLMEYKSGAWTVAEKDITLGDGTVISLKGNITGKDGKMISIKEGETVKKTGQFFDKAGNAIANAWDAAKEGVKNAVDATKEGVKDAANAVKEGAEDAGKAVEEGAKKVGDKAKKVVDAHKH